MQWPTQAQARKFYGAPGTGHAKLVLPFQMHLAWDMNTLIHAFTVHEKCVASASIVFNKIAKLYPTDEIRLNLGISIYSGCYADRPMRGGSQPSMHSFACAIDFDDTHNQMKWGKDRARLAKADCVPFWEAWESEGWVSLGRSRNFDWMHVQAARL
jgi:hypothetical protein